MGFASRGQGLGSTFYFELPLYSAATAGVDPTTSSTTASAPTSAFLGSNSLPAEEDELRVPVLPLISARKAPECLISRAIRAANSSQSSRHQRDDTTDEQTTDNVPYRISIRPDAAAVVPPISTKSHFGSFMEVISLGPFVLRKLL